MANAFSCPICGKSSFTDADKKEKGGFFICKNCGCSFWPPPPKKIPRRAITLPRALNILIDIVIMFYIVLFYAILFVSIGTVAYLIFFEWFLNWHLVPWQLVIGAVIGGGPITIAVGLIIGGGVLLIGTVFALNLGKPVDMNELYQGIREEEMSDPFMSCAILRDISGHQSLKSIANDLPAREKAVLHCWNECSKRYDPCSRNLFFDRRFLREQIKVRELEAKNNEFMRYWEQYRLSSYDVYRRADWARRIDQAEYLLRLQRSIQRAWE